MDSSQSWTSLRVVRAERPRKVLEQPTDLGSSRGFTASSSSPRASRTSHPACRCHICVVRMKILPCCEDRQQATSCCVS